MEKIYSFYQVSQCYFYDNTYCYKCSNLLSNDKDCKFNREARELSK